jgi:hypothetical protein
MDPAASLDLLRQQVVTSLVTLAPEVDSVPGRRGRPPILIDTHLWGCTLLAVLDGCPTQRGIWREVTTGQRGGEPVAVEDETVRKRLLTRESAPMASFFAQITDLLTQSLPGDSQLAPFAPEIYALDATTLDKVVRTDADTGQRPLAGRVHTCFDLRRQCFRALTLTANPAANERPQVPPLVADLPAGSLLVMDRGYTAFALFDQLVADGFHLLTRYDKTFTVTHTLTNAPGVRDELGFCGAYRADKGQTLLRRITVAVPGHRPRTYLTSVRDPQVLPPHLVVQLYARRWDVETAFKTVKRTLGLHLIWSNHWSMIALQVWATLVIFQIASGLRGELARRAGVSVLEVSLALLQRLPRIVQDGPPGQDALAFIVSRGRYGGFIRPVRRTTLEVPTDLPVDPPPDDLPTRRPGRGGSAAKAARTKN